MRFAHGGQAGTWTVKRRPGSQNASVHQPIAFVPDRVPRRDNPARDAAIGEDGLPFAKSANH
jgi:hypothetical protein